MSTRQDWQAAASRIAGDLQTELSAERRIWHKYDFKKKQKENFSPHCEAVQLSLEMMMP